MSEQRSKCRHCGLPTVIDGNIMVEWHTVTGEAKCPACNCPCHDPSAWDEYVVHMSPCCDRTGIKGWKG